eukprot:m51a1_g3672 putative beta-hexosaminidase subunit beta-like (597) ;mRNA; r:276261-278505
MALANRTLFVALVVVALVLTLAALVVNNPAAADDRSAPCPPAPVRTVYVYVDRAGGNRTVGPDAEPVGPSPSPLPWARDCSAAPDAHLWPAPLRRQRLPGAPVPVDAEALRIALEGPGAGHPVLARAAARYETLVRAHARTLAGYARAPRPPAGAPAVALATVRVEQGAREAGQHVQHGADESYEVEVTAEGAASVGARTVWGALRGLETLYQALGGCDGAGHCCAAPVRVEDAPRYAWRGFMVDTARHFVPVEKLEAIVDGLAYLKYNVMHWHATDSCAFPLALEDAPELAAKGAYGPRQVYTPADVAHIVEYANDRGVRVMPELDVPAHTGSWRPAYPDLIFDCKNLHKWKVDRMAMDATREEVYEVLGRVLRELARRFPDSHMHLGGDEVFYDCWTAAKTVSAWMKQRGETNVRALTGYFNERVAAITNPLNKTVVMWEEAHEATKLPHRRVVLQVWYGAEHVVRKILDMGNSLIDSHVNFLYVQREMKWQDIYNYDPSTRYADPRWSQRLLGAEMCMWGELVDGDNIEQMIWLPAAAAAERMWSQNSVVAQQAAGSLVHRMTAEICRLKHRGLLASVVWSGTCYPPTYILRK